LIRRGVVRAVVVVLALGLVGGLGASWYMGGVLTEPAMHPIAPPPVALGASAITFPSQSGSMIHGWYSRGVAGKGAVLLFHGMGSNRTMMVRRALFLHALGYSVLAIDFQAHGESAGEAITVGDLESWDVVAASEYLRHALPEERIGAIGVSLGAAAVVLSKKPLGLSAVVLESMYPTIEEAVDDRLKISLGPWGAICTPLLTLQLKPRLGIDPARLRPIDSIARIGAPLLLIHGVEDRHTRIEEARREFAAAAEPKTFWEVPGAAHVNLYDFVGQEYERRIDAFFAQYLTRR
jgi:pimeloyl-ACP methyl ester carboxylesterase